MIKDFKFSLTYKKDGSILRAEGLDNELYTVKTAAADNGIELTIVPKTKIEMVNAYLDFDYGYRAEDKVYVNGYQSWTVSKEYTKADVQPGIMGLGGMIPTTKKMCEIFGDYLFQSYSKQPGIFHSYSYTYIKRDGKIDLMGTVTERNGYTVFHHDMNTGKISVQKDVEGVTIDSEYTLHRIVWFSGEYDAAFDAYFEAIGIKKPQYKRMNGYTSWYNYYGNITEKQLLRDLEGLATVGDAADIFQIDDGYETAVGDWTSLKPSYPNGMRYITDKIHGHNYKAGLWLAPFNAQKKSKLAKEHPEWLIKQPDGKPELGCIAWGGAYTLDFYIPEAAEYIRDVFRTVFGEWNFDMVKLDFLYSVCISPRRNKSRGQIMTEAMEFLRECVGDKIILGCGVPLFPAFGLVDFCRISCDMGKSFVDPFFVKHSNQEIFSTRNAMNNTVFRRHLDGRAFVNDPDVFYLRENNLKGKDEFALASGKLKFTETQKVLLATVNSMCGNVLFVSDNVGGYESEQRLKQLKLAFQPSERKVISADMVDSTTMSIVYVENGITYELRYDVITGSNETTQVK